CRPLHIGILKFLCIEAIAIFISDAFETGDAEYIVKAMGVVARAKGMTELARETGLSREQLYRSIQP
ncbi:Cro/CI family transcriptional regulator, partial [Pseudomonas cannabina]